MSDLEELGQLITVKTASLDTPATDLLRRGLEDSLQLAADSRLRPLIFSLEHSSAWKEKITAWEELRQLPTETPGWLESLRLLIYRGRGWPRLFAAEALAWHGQAARDTVPVLSVALEATLSLGRLDWARLVCGALGRYDKLPDSIMAQAVPPLLDALESSDPDVQGYAAQALQKAGRLARPAMVRLAILAERSAPPLQKIFLTALQEIDPDIDQPLTALRQALDAPDPELRRRALAALGDWPSSVKTILPDLLQAAKDIEPDVLQQLALTLGRQALDHADSRDVLQNLAGNDSPGVALAAHYALARFNHESALHQKALRQGLREKDPLLRRLSARILGEIGDRFLWQTRRALNKALRNETDPATRTALELSLSRLEG